MRPLFAKKCKSCGFDNSWDANFCEKCGIALTGSSGKKCAICGADNKQDATYCTKCGRPLSVNQETEVRGNHWSRRPDDFAARLEIGDLPGLLNKKLEVEIGTQALIISSGSPQEVLPPGFYTVENIGKTITNWLKGIPNSITALLVNTSPTELSLQIANRFTSDPLPISLSIRMVLKVESASKFLLTTLQGQERYSLDELRSYIEPEVTAVLDQYLRGHTLEQLVTNPATRNELELAVDEALRMTFEQYGLKLMSLRTAELDLVAYDKIKGIKGNYSLLVSEGEAKLSGEEQMLELQKKLDLHELAKDTAKVELEERKVELYQRMRQTVMTDKMNEVKSEEDFRKFMDEIDYQKLLSEKERQDLVRGWKEAGEDHERARAFLLAKADVEEKYELRAVEVKSSGELALAEQEYQLQLARKRAEMTLQIQEMEWESTLKKRQHELEIQKEEFSQDMAEAHQAIALLNEMDDHALEIRLKEARANVEIEIRRLESNHRLEMERLEKLGTLGTEALIAASPVEQGRILQDIKRTEIYKNMTEDQILALAAEKNPELGKVFEEKYRAIAEGKANEREREMYEKLIAENKDNLKLLLDSQREAMDRLQQMSQHGMDSIKEVSMAYAQKGSEPVIITGQNGSSVIQTGRAGMGNPQFETKNCPGCGRQVPVDSRFCPHCRNEFKDVN